MDARAQRSELTTCGKVRRQKWPADPEGPKQTNQRD